MIKTWCAGLGTAALLGLLLWGCGDKLEVQRAYDFGLSCWHLQSGIRQGERVEIRFTLTREGLYEGAEYYVGYIQTEGRGEVADSEGRLLVNREIVPLREIPGLDESDPARQVFTLWYTSTSDKASELRFVVADNFAQERSLTVNFRHESGKQDL